MNSQKDLKNNVKELIEELLTYATNFPKQSSYKYEIIGIINKLKSGTSLKEILTFIKNKLQINNPNIHAAYYKENREFWFYILKTFTKRF
jgi:hypothetical protein